MRIEDKDRLAKIYDQHKIVKNAERFIDAALIADTIRNARQSEDVTEEVLANQVFDFSYLTAR
jgi:hypothetical protein